MIKTKRKRQSFDGFCDNCGITGNKDITKRCWTCKRPWIDQRHVKDIIMKLIEDKPISHQLWVIEKCIEEGAFTLENGEKIVQ